jgi:hypothetical protein
MTQVISNYLNWRSVTMAGLLVLAGCNTVGPFAIKINPKQSFSLATNKGQWRRFENPETLTASYSAFTKKFYLADQNSQIVFSNVEAVEQDSRTYVLSVEPGSSGQKTAKGVAVGLYVKANMTDVNVDRQELRENCTYYTRENYQHCEKDKKGHRHCETRTRNVPHSGTQWVEHERITRYFKFTGRITGANLTLATGEGFDKTVEVNRRPTSSCY